MAIGHPQFYRSTGNDPHWERLPEELKRIVNEHIASLTDVDIGQPCIWLDRQSRQCRHYDYRPQMCRDFEIGSPHCVRMRESHGITAGE